MVDFLLVLYVLLVLSLIFGFLFGVAFKLSLSSKLYSTKKHKNFHFPDFKRNKKVDGVNNESVLCDEFIISIDEK